MGFKKGFISDLKMQEMGKMIATNVEVQAMLFLYLNYGVFLSKTFVEGYKITSVTDEEIINASIELFVKGLHP